MKEKIRPQGKSDVFHLVCSFVNTRKLPVIVFVLAVLVRLVYLIDYAGSPFFQEHIADALFHEEWADAVVKGDIFSLRQHGVFYKAPFYPYFIAFVYLVSDRSDLVVMLIQVVMSGISCVLLFLIGRIYFDDIAAFIGALIYAFYFPSVFFSTEMEIPASAVFLTLLSFYLLIINKGTLRVIVSAVVFGLSLCALPTNLLLLPLYGYLIFKKRGVKTVVVFAVVAFAVIFPVTLRNLIAGKHPTAISANGGINFYIGNNESYDESVSLQPGYAFEDFYDEPLKTFGAGSFAERDAYWYGKAFAFITEHPVKEIALVLKKLVLYFSDYEIMRNRDTYFAKSESVYRYIPFFPASFILAAGLVGMALAVYKKKGRSLMLFCFLLALPSILFFVTSRYRMPSMCVWAVFAGFSLTIVVRSVIDGKPLPGIVTAASIVCLAVLSNLNIFVVKNPAYRPRFNLGFIYEKQAHYGPALDEYAQSLDLIDPQTPHALETVSEVYARMGNVYMKQGNLDKAEAYLLKSIDVKPDSYPAYSYLGTLYEKRKRIDTAEEMYEKAIEIDPWDVISIYNLGLLYLDNNRFDEAIAQFTRAIEVYPQHSGAYSNLAYIYGIWGNLDIMEDYAKKAVFHNPEETPARYNLATLYLNTGREKEAVEQYREIIRHSPGESAAAYNKLGVIEARKNDLERAVRYWKKALEIDPDYEDAAVNLKTASELMKK
ncbi:MAG: tetratricopeptide repeat protein [Spirochaetales bacterium]|nr:tetratricopeptide repeat protein [Spirochaetales bacterium]